jgi:hypothetical protein
MFFALLSDNQAKNTAEHANSGRPLDRRVRAPSSKQPANTVVACKRGVFSAQDRVNPSLLPAMLDYKHVQMPSGALANGTATVNEYECLAVAY